VFIADLTGEELLEHFLNSKKPLLPVLGPEGNHLCRYSVGTGNEGFNKARVLFEDD
jgi:hypothetical protein